MGLRVKRSSDAHDAAGGAGSPSAGGLTVTTWPDQPPPSDTLQLTLTNSSGLANPIQYNVVPLIGTKGLNGSDTINQTIHIDGLMVAADQSNFERLTTSDTVAYLSCDRQHGTSGSSSSGSSSSSSSSSGGGSNGGGDTYINASRMLNTLIGNSIKAIILYSEVKNGCLLSNVDSLQYSNILSMIDAGDAQQVLGYLNGTDPNERVAIVGNTSVIDAGRPARSAGAATNSAVAMSILYSITGLITLLFLAIIATGAVRAHRYPERYGPRSGVAGQPRQSRAKGLARAVLDTIPIVKFNNEQPVKPDPELELDAATMDGRETIMTQRDAAEAADMQLHPDMTPAIRNDGGTSGGTSHGESNSNDECNSSGENHSNSGDKSDTPGISNKTTNRNSNRNSKRNSSAGTVAGSSHEREEGTAAVGVNLGCSICTEDFKIGEDMRVLPCSHQFHPACIDPWLVNVSGTCPLCRMDLNAEAGNSGEEPPDAEGSTLPPPLPMDGVDREASPTTHRHRLSRLFDINRLRQASAEEQLAALREMRRSETRRDSAGAEPPAAEARAETTTTAAEGSGPERSPEGGEGEERTRRVRLSMRLKEKFRILTSTRAADHPHES